MAKVLVGHCGQSTLFVAIHCRFGGLYVARGARLNFDKTQDILVPPNQVDFSPSTRRPKVARHHHVPQTPQVEVRIFLAPPPRPLMHGGIVGRKRSLRHPVQRPNRSLRNPP